MALCEFVGGPRDGERFTVPGTLPPTKVTVMAQVGDLRMWHVAAGADVPVVVCWLIDEPEATGPWRYRWPRDDATVAPQ